MAFIPKQQYSIALSGTASTALDIFEGESSKPSNLQIVVYSDIDTVVNLGNNSVVADETVTSNKMPSGNSFLPEGALMIYGLADDQKYISAIAADGSSTGTLYLTRGLGEKI